MKKEEILSICIEEVRSGRSTAEECLARFPGLRDELLPLLEIAVSIQSPAIAPSAEFTRRTRAHLAEVMGPAPWAHRTPAIHWRPGPVFSARALSLALCCLVVVWLVGTAGGTVYAAQGSLPGDALYPVKISSEELHLAVTLHQEDRAYLRLALAERRIDELVAVSSLNPDVGVATAAAAAAHLDNALRDMGNAQPGEARAFASRLAETSLQEQVTLDRVLVVASPAAQPALQQVLDVAKRGNIIAQVAYGNPVFLSRHPSVLDESLETGRFTIQGNVEKVEGRTWKVGGVTLGNVNSPDVSLTPDTPVRVDGVTSKNEVYIVKVEHDEESKDEAKIQGVFGGAGAGGKTWYVSGIPVNAPPGEAAPAAGDKLELNGTARNGAPTAAKVQAGETKQEKQKAELVGTLTGVNPGSGTITTSSAGASTVLNVSEARIRAENGERLSAGDLASLVGKGIRVQGIYPKDGSLYAVEVRVGVAAAANQKGTGQPQAPPANRNPAPDTGPGNKQDNSKQDNRGGQAGGNDALSGSKQNDRDKQDSGSPRSELGTSNKQDGNTGSRQDSEERRGSGSTEKSSVSPSPRQDNGGGTGDGRGSGSSSGRDSRSQDSRTQESSRSH